MNKLIRLCGLCILATGCSSTYKHSLDFNPSEPLRVMIAPFVQVDSSGTVVDDSVNRAGTKIRKADRPTVFLRRLVQNELSKSQLDVFPASLVDSELSHHGYAHTDMSPNLEKIAKTAPAELCTHLLNCDAVMYGTVRDWSRDYYAVQTVNSMALDLRLVSARDGKVIFSSSAKDSDSRGLSKGPTGFSDLVIEPIRGLDKDILNDLSRKVVAKMLEPLRSKARPEYLEDAPPSIYGSVHDGSNGAFSVSKPLTVLAYATPHMALTFSIGSVVESVPMNEIEEGRYYGQYYPLPGDAFAEQPVTISITDKYGRSSRESVTNGPVSLAR